MKQLSEKFIEQTYFVKDEVIFNIKKSFKGTDACAVKVEDKEGNEYKDKLPFITADGKTLYLDVYIEDGDKFDGSEFKKSIHGEEDETVTFQEYFMKMVEEELKYAVKRYFEKPFSWFDDSLDTLGLPLFAFEGKGNAEGIEQISFTPEYLDDMKKQVVKDDINAAAHEILDSYEYEVVGGDPEFDVQPKGTEPTPDPEPEPEPEPTPDPEPEPEPGPTIDEHFNELT